MNIKQHAIVIIFILVFSTISYSQENIAIDFNKLESSGTFVLNNFSGTPQGRDGIIKTFTLEFPEYKSGVYYAGDIPDIWPAQHNRVLPWTFKKDSVKDLNYGGLFLTVLLESGEYLVIVPIAEDKSMSWLHVDESGRMVISLGTLGTKQIEGDFNIFTWSRSKDLYKSAAEAWQVAMQKVSTAGARITKVYPEPFKYLGWCSWEQYHKNINDSILVDATLGIENSDIPIRWVLVDDGHDDVIGKTLVSFIPDKEKFPHGWKSLISLKKEDKIKWFGIWQNNQGYWQGIAKENKLGNLNDSMANMPCGFYLPKGDIESVRSFYDAYMKSVKNYGFDFVKIDDQSRILLYYRGTENAVESAINFANAREEATAKYQNSYIINCMAHNSTCFFTNQHSAVTRCSIDYIYGNIKSGKSHIWQSFNNSLWIGQSVWPDHDMFHSSDPENGRLIAVSKALSGAPIYLSDAPEDLISEYIMPLCYNDGLLLRPEAPAIPLPESAMFDPLTQKQSYRVIAPLVHQSAVVALYNLYDSENTSISATLNPEDYKYRTGLLQPYPGQQPQPEEGLILYDWYEKKVLFLTKSILQS